MNKLARFIAKLRLKWSKFIKQSWKYAKRRLDTVIIYFSVSDILYIIYTSICRQAFCRLFSFSLGFNVTSSFVHSLSLMLFEISWSTGDEAKLVPPNCLDSVIDFRLSSSYSVWRLSSDFSSFIEASSYWAFTRL